MIPKKQRIYLFIASRLKLLSNQNSISAPSVVSDSDMQLYGEGMQFTEYLSN